MDINLYKALFYLLVKKRVQTIKQQPPVKNYIHNLVNSLNLKYEHRGSLLYS